MSQNLSPKKTDVGVKHLLTPDILPIGATVANALFASLTWTDPRSTPNCMVHHGC